MSIILDSVLDEERLRECQAHDTQTHSIRHPAAIYLDDAEACLHAARRAYTEDALHQTVDYLRATILNLSDAIIALQGQHEPET